MYCNKTINRIPSRSVGEVKIVVTCKYANVLCRPFVVIIPLAIVVDQNFTVEIMADSICRELEVL